MNAVSINVGLKLTPTRVSGITQSEVDEYTAVSGDRNPIHSDTTLARKAGLAGVPVQGMLIMALVSSYVETWQHCNSLNKLNVRFVAPTMINQDIIISARVVSMPEQQGIAILRVTVLQNEKLVCMGEAEILCENPS